MRKLFILFAAVMMALGYAEKASAVVLEGNIGPYAITMVLNENYTRGKYQSYVGYYYYNRNPKNRFKLYLVGLKQCSEAELLESGGDGCQRIRLQEHSPSGNITGEFLGIDVWRLRVCNYRDPDADHSGKSMCSYIDFHGTFINKSNGKQFDFAVEGVLKHD